MVVDMYRILSCLFLLPMLLFSCGKGQNNPVEISGDTVALSHSSLLTIVECDGYTVVDIANPWNDGLLKRYLLVPGDADMPDSLPAGVLLRTPLDNVVIFSGIHAVLLEELGVENVIAGVCDADYIYSETVAEGLADGTVLDCGSSLNVDVEKLVQLSPSAIFTLPYENGGYGKLDKLDLPIVECADYMESSSLGCAEWIRFYGRLVGKAKQADSLFFCINAEYERLRTIVSSVTERPTLMCELKSSAAWYVPAGGSTMGRMYSDAGAEYLFAGYAGRGSVPLSLETVLGKAADADIWLIKYNSTVDNSLTGLLAESPVYAQFAPFKSGNIYACDTHRKRIFEATVFHPEILLKELIAIFHPHLLPDYQLDYYEKIIR